MLFTCCLFSNVPPQIARKKLFYFFFYYFFFFRPFINTFNEKSQAICVTHMLCVRLRFALDETEDCHSVNKIVRFLNIKNCDNQITVIHNIMYIIMLYRRTDRKHNELRNTCKKITKEKSGFRF